MVRITQWNVQSMNDKTNKRKKILSYIQELKPLAIILNESRETGITIKGYRTIEALPSKMRNGKLNATINIDDRVNFC